MGMPLIDKVSMGPFEKYEEYGKFPYKMFLHILLSIVLTAQIFLLVNYNATYTQSAMRRFFTWFFDEDMELDGTDYSRIRYFYSVEDLAEHVNWSIDNYFGIEEEDTIESYSLIREYDERDDVERVLPVIMTPYFIRKTERLNWPNLNFNLTQTDRGPFNKLESISNMTNFQLLYHVRHNIPTTHFTTFDCYEWIIYSDFTIINQGHFSQQLRFDRQF